MNRISSAQPSISVIIPVRNEERFVAEAIASISRQTFREFEMIVVDNGSTDATAKIIENCAANEPRLRHLRLDKPCLHESVRRAVDMSRGFLLARLDADDVAAPDRLQRQYEKMVGNPALGLLGSAAEFVDHRGRVIGFTSPLLTDGELKAYLPTGCPFVHSSVMMRRDAYFTAGGYRTGLNLSEDYDLWMRMSAVTGMANLPERLVQYRQRGDSVSALRPVRLAVAASCVAAAGIARQNGVPEPMVGGVPFLRRALPLLSISRRELRLRIYRDAFERSFLAFPLPFPVKRGLRKAAIACGLKPFFQFLLHVISSARGARQTIPPPSAGQ